MIRYFTTARLRFSTKEQEKKIYDRFAVIFVVTNSRKNIFTEYGLGFLKTCSDRSQTTNLSYIASYCVHGALQQSIKCAICFLHRFEDNLTSDARLTFSA